MASDLFQASANTAFAKPMLHPEQPKLIVLEGIDLSGRTTQVQLLHDWLAAQNHRRCGDRKPRQDRERRERTQAAQTKAKRAGATSSRDYSTVVRRSAGKFPQFRKSHV